MYMPENGLDKYMFTEDEIDRAIKEVAPILEENIKNSIQSVISDPSDSALVNSVKTKISHTKTDATIAWVGPSGKDKNGVRNIEKAIYLNYGTYRNGGEYQPARPWLHKAINDSADRVNQKLNDILGKRFE